MIDTNVELKAFVAISKRNFFFVCESCKLVLKVCKEMLRKTIHKETFLRNKSASENPCM